jgi:hypothetical protein
MYNTSWFELKKSAAHSTSHAKISAAATQRFGVGCLERYKKSGDAVDW